jgi:TRAP-type mannitol/chloroaromatic compound transport system substrate-binding protein
MRAKRSLVLVLTALVLAYAFVMMPLPAAAQTEKAITLNFVSFAPAAVWSNSTHQKALRQNQSACQGQIGDQCEGGPEVIPPFNLGAAVKNGTIDMACIPNAFLRTWCRASALLTFLISARSRNGRTACMKP